MFAASLPAVPYSDPWNIPLPVRFKMMARGRRRIAYYYEEANNSTFRYRAYNMAQVLNDVKKNNDVSAGYFFQADLHQIHYIVDLADVLVICRSGYCHRVNDLITQFRRRQKRILFDVDDLVFDPMYAHLIMTTLDQDVNDAELWDYWFAYTGRMAATMRLCDGVITTNDYLADRIAVLSGLPVQVVPNFINKEQLELSERLFRKKEASGFTRDGKIHLGYFSGSPSHNLDFEIIVSALENLLDDDPRLELVITGYIETHPLLKRFGKRVIKQPFHDYVNLQRLMGGVEFNLVPLQSNVFTSCKSELKYFEAAAAGTISIASPTYTYAKSINHGHNGYLSRAHQWASVIRQAIGQMDSYQEMASTAFADVCTKYAWLSQRKVILKALGMQPSGEA